MNNAIEAGISGFVSIIGLAIIFVIGWFAYKAFNFLFDSSKPEPRPTVEPEPKRTTGIVERPFSKDFGSQVATSKGSPVEQGQFVSSAAESHEQTLSKNKKFAVAIAILALIFVPTLYCSDAGDSCITSGWEFIFSFGYKDRLDIQRMLLQLVVAGIICALLIRKKS